MVNVLPDPYYSDEWCTVYCGDALDILPALDAEAAHLCAMDPPYFNVVDEDWDTQWGANTRAFLEWLAGVLKLAERATHERGTLAVFSSPDMAAFVEMEVRKVADVFNSIVWRKPGLGRLGASDKEMLRSFFNLSERIVLAEKCRNPDGDLFRFRSHVNHKVTREVHTELIDRLIALQQAAQLTGSEVDAALGKNGMAGHYFGRSQWCLPTVEAWSIISGLAAARGVTFPPHEELRAQFEARRGEFEHRRREFDSHRREFESARREFGSTVSALELENLSDVWTFTPPPPTARTANHPTAKPEALMRHMIATMTRPGDLVLDPFAGSGTSLRAAKDLGRRSIGIELDERYCRAIVDRLAQEVLPFS